MRKLIVSAVVGAFLVFAPAAFPIAITNPDNGTCHEAVTPPTFNGNSNAFPDNPGGVVGPWDGVFMSGGNSAAITGVFCPS
jgi:hypothetical protein